MKKLIVLAIVFALVLSLSGCAMLATIGGTTIDPQGVFPFASGVGEAIGATEIGSYQIILGLVNLGYPEYAKAVSTALSQNKQVATEISTILNIITTVKAFAK